MRTTVTLDPDTAALVQRLMRQRKVSFKQALNDAIRAGATDAGDRPRFVLETAQLGQPKVNLDKALQVAAELEDEAIIAKLKLGR